MQLDFKARVSRVVYFTLNLLEEIHEFPEEVDSEECRSTVLSLLNGFNDSPLNPETLQSVRYALTAWIDDVFSRTPWPHSAYWNVHLLEQELFGTACRQWRFFEQAEAALRRRDWIALSVFQLCVNCGFRGIYAKNRMKVQLNDRLPMLRTNSKTVRSLPILAGVLHEETSGVSARVERVDWEPLSNTGIAQPQEYAPSSPPDASLSIGVLPPTINEWCQTTFGTLGHRDDKSLKDLVPSRLIPRSLPSKRVLTEWAIVMAIGVLLSAVLVSLGF